MVAIAVAAILSVMVGTLIHQAFDIHDTTPFPIDPEAPTFMLGSLLIFCVGIVALTAHLLSFSLALSELLSLERLDISSSSTRRHLAFEVERLLFSPPLRVTSLRI